MFSRLGPMSGPCPPARRRQPCELLFSIPVEVDGPSRAAPFKVGGAED